MIGLSILNVNWFYIVVHQNDAGQGPSSQGDESPRDMVDKDDDQTMACEGDDAGKTKEKKTTKTVRQNEKLYTAEGILNPKIKRAEKKKKKKAKAASASVDAMDDDGDYDFKVDYKNKGSAMDASDDELEE